MVKVKLLRQNRIDGRAGDIVEVSPARAAFLMGYGMAEPAEVRERTGTPEDKPVKKTAAKKGAKK